MPVLDHERLDVYKLGLDFVATASTVVENLPKGRAYLADQLNRAATSIVLNIAEGAGEFSPPDKARFYRIARRSATESAACLDICRKLGLVDQQRYDSGRRELLQLVAMLVGLCRISGKGRGKGMGTGAPSDNRTRPPVPLPLPLPLPDRRSVLCCLEGIVVERRHALSDQDWCRISALLPPRRGHRGRPWNDHRRTVDGILWVLQTGARGTLWVT